MSFLTKLFIVLHVVVSMLLTAGLIVFVERAQNFDRENTEMKAMRDAAEARSHSAEDELNALKAAKDAQVGAAVAEARAIKEQLDAAQGTGRDLQKQLAVANANLSSSQAATKSQSDALKVAQDTMGLLHDQTNQIRSQNDKLQGTNTEQSVAIADLTNKYTVTRKQLAVAEEEIADLKTRVADAGGNVRNVQPGAVAASPINGVVRATRNIGGVDYATISVGSSDSVAKGMQFNVLDRNKGDFLGYITITAVEPNEATGRIEGPHKRDIKAGSEVRTQLQ